MQMAVSAFDRGANAQFETDDGRHDPPIESFSRAASTPYPIAL